MSKIIFHIGYPRTGTSYLQKKVFIKLKSLNFLGKPFNKYNAKLFYNFEKKIFSFCLKLVSTINLTIGNISKHVAVFDNHMLMNAVIKIKQRRIIIAGMAVLNREAFITCV